MINTMTIGSDYHVYYQVNIAGDYHIANFCDYHVYYYTETIDSDYLIDCYVSIVSDYLEGRWK